MTADPSARPRVLAFSGSERQGSLNARLLGLVAAEVERQGAAVTRLSLRNQALPLYDGDLEAGGEVPASVGNLRGLIRSHDFLLIACPEHNGSVTALLKNALDWCSRPVDGQPALALFQRKPVLIVGTSISPFGGLRAIGHLRAILAKMGAMVLPMDLAVPNGDKALAAEGFGAEGLERLAANAVAALLRERCDGCRSLDVLRLA